MNCGEGAAYDSQTAAKLIATGVCRIADDELGREALEAAVRATSGQNLLGAGNCLWCNPDISKLNCNCNYSEPSMSAASSVFAAQGERGGVAGIHDCHLAVPGRQKKTGLAR
jgi:hypothetical protein